MCAIGGIVNLQKTHIFEKSEGCKLDTMLGLMKHRGPDERGVFVAQDYILGSMRLKIIGDEYGKQPMIKNSKSLIFNGEIYNYKELAEDIRKNHIKDVILSSDTAVLFCYLNKNGINAINKFNGMFAFCYATEDAIYLAKDRFGQKPLFYVLKDNKLYFASEIKAFSSFMDFELEISNTYTCLETEVLQNTIFKNIYQVEPGSFLKIDRRTKSISKTYYYKLNPQKSIHLSHKGLSEKLRWLVQDAINIRTNIKIKYGVYVSGGIDSSLVSLLSHPSHLFTYLPNNKIIPNEEKYVDILATNIPNAKLIKVKEEWKFFLSNFIQMVYYNDGPVSTLAAYSQYLLSKEVQRYNLRVVFSGLGADEFLNGYVRHAITFLPKNYFDNELFVPYKKLISKGYSSNSNIPKNKLYENLINRQHVSNSMLSTCISNVFKSNGSILTAMSICESMFTLPPLLHTDDHLNMAFGIESRSPFMDYRLVEFALCLPDESKIYTNIKSEVYTKYLLREAFKDILPMQIYHRNDKVGFTSNVNGLLSNVMKSAFVLALKLLQKEFPANGYFIQPNKSFQEFSRWKYQIFQLAITYLLFIKKYSRDEVHEYFSQGYECKHSLVN